MLTWKKVLTVVVVTVASSGCQSTITSPFCREVRTFEPRDDRSWCHGDGNVPPGIPRFPA
jgi:hypothetical protein